MSQEGRVLQTLAGSRIWLTGEVRPLGNVSHAGGCGPCALLHLSRRCSWEDGPVKRSEAGDLQTNQVMAKKKKWCMCSVSNAYTVCIHIYCHKMVKVEFLMKKNQLNINWFFWKFWTSFCSCRHFQTCAQCCPLFPVSPVLPPTPTHPLKKRLIQTTDCRDERGRPKSSHLFMYYGQMLCSLAPQLLQGS